MFRVPGPGTVNALSQSHHAIRTIKHLPAIFIAEPKRTLPHRPSPHPLRTTPPWCRRSRISTHRKDDESPHRLENIRNRKRKLLLLPEEIFIILGEMKTPSFSSFSPPILVSPEPYADFSSEVQCGQRTALTGMADRQKGHSLVKGDGAGAGCFMRFT